MKLQRCWWRHERVRSHADGHSYGSASACRAPHRVVVFYMQPADQSGRTARKCFADAAPEKEKGWGTAMKQRTSPSETSNNANKDTPTGRRTLSLSSQARVDGACFAFVWAEGRRAPRTRHPSVEAATAEAERLSRLFPEIRFHVYIARRLATRCGASSSE